MTNNNVQNVKFLRNSTLFTSREEAKNTLTNFTLTPEMDGSSILARYQVGTDPIKTLVGYVYYKDASDNSVTIFDVDDAGSDVDKKILSAIQALDADVTSSEKTNVQVKVTEVDGKITAVNIINDNTVNSNDVASAIETKIGTLEYSDTAVPGQYVSQVSQTDGKIAVVRVDLPDASSVSGDSKVLIDVTQDKGQIKASAANLSGVKLDGYSEAATTGDVASTDTLGEALGKLQKTIHEMDKAASAVDGQVVTTVYENDGVVSEKKVNVKDLQLGGYVKGEQSGEISGTDTINIALSKIENNIAASQSATTVTNTDHSINVTTAATGTTIGVNINSGEKVISLGNGGIYTDIKLSAVTVSEANVKEAFALIASDGATQLGSTIKIYKDSSLVNLYLGHVDDLLSGTTAQTEESESSVVVPGSGSEALVWIVQLADDKYKLAAVDVESFLQESEFKNGLQVSNHEVSVKVDSTSEAVTTGESVTANVLSVSSEGVKVGNIQAAIDYKVSTLDATVSGQTADGKVKVQVVQENGVLSAVTVTSTDIASDSALAAEIAARKAVDGQNGDTYAANKSSSYINNAISLNDADVKLAAALKTLDNDAIKSVKVNNTTLSETSGAVGINISAVHGTGSDTPAIVVNTANNGDVTLQINYIDAGVYDAN